MTIDRDWLKTQTMFHFGQAVGLAHKKGATRDDMEKLADGFTDKVLAKIDARYTASYENK